MKIIFTLILALLPVTSYAANLLIPAEFSVLRVNGEEFSSSFIQTDTKLELNTGQNVVVLKYAEIFEDDFDDSHQTIKSEAFILLFSVANQQDLKFSYTKPKDKEQAKAFSKKPIVNIHTKSGSKLALINQSLSTYNDQVMQETISRRQEVVKQSLEVDDQTTFTKTGPDNLAMLKYWWAQASDSEKKEFLKQLKLSQ
ncbi:DUF2057 domain-containing protein [Thalassomonas sp. M1454]|uniref:DUF2057 domain-containing protein n=1 Tax=Thalassomonas sp. M1454 TaxID=2594477 RepID=UPI00117F85C3|nr:DUF2057 domain-containing protein [Thalassomonas sp. M1454]TRX56659.1 DUF2057 domain-containing protein [Thalassomonas sp. M1454]